MKKETLGDVILPANSIRDMPDVWCALSAVWSAVLSALARAVWPGAMVLCCGDCAAVPSVEMGFLVCGSGGGSSRARYKVVLFASASCKEG